MKATVIQNKETPIESLQVVEIKVVDSETLSLLIALHTQGTFLRCALQATGTRLEDLKNNDFLSIEYKIVNETTVQVKIHTGSVG